MSNPIDRSLSNRVIFWVSAFAFIVIGVYLSHIRFMNSEWLSRAGCLVVMLGIWSGIGGIFQERLFLIRINRRRQNAIVRSKARLAQKQVDPEQMEKELGEINQNFENESEKGSLNLRLSIGVLEMSLLMTGTFLWGFGDLFVL